MRPRSRLPRGALVPAQVNLGYYPFEIAEACALRIGPGEHFSARLELGPGALFAVQSIVNPHCLAAPRRREPINGWVCGYAHAHGPAWTGWVPEASLRPAAHRGWATGPAGGDFEIGSGHPRRRSLPLFVRGRPASARAKVRAPYAYLRYAWRSSAFAYALGGEQVEVRWIYPGWRFCRLRPEALLGRESHGWILAGALEPG